MSASTVRLTEVFYSLQGESNTVGIPTVFVRLTGCPLRCGYCDSAYAFNGGEVFTIADVLSQVAQYQPRYITVTGGEPLAQPGCLSLLTQLCNQFYTVSIETSGALNIEHIDPRVHIVMDLKTPGSLELDKNRYENIAYLQTKDQVKFVITDRADYEWSKTILAQYQLTDRVGEVLFSPSHGQLEAVKLANWIIEDNLAVRFQMQIHKFLWNDEPGH